MYVYMYMYRLIHNVPNAGGAAAHVRDVAQAALVVALQVPTPAEICIYRNMCMHVHVFIRNMYMHIHMYIRNMCILSCHM